LNWVNNFWAKTLGYYSQLWAVSPKSLLGAGTLFGRGTFHAVGWQDSGKISAFPFMMDWASINNLI